MMERKQVFTPWYFLATRQAARSMRPSEPMRAAEVSPTAGLRAVQYGDPAQAGGLRRGNDLHLS